MEDIGAAIFFDNVQAHLNEVKAQNRNIKLVKIPDTQPCNGFGKTEEPYKSYLASLGPNTYVDELPLYDMYDPVSGIQENHIRILNRWLSQTRYAHQRAAIFDWDRTLTMVEGLYPIESTETLHFEDALLYLMGGSKRLFLLRKMFDKLHRLKVELFILTNNMASLDPFFKQLVHCLSPHIPPTNILCAYATHRGNKGHALEQNDRLSTIRLIKYRRKTRKSRDRSH